MAEEPAVDHDVGAGHEARRLFAGQINRRTGQLAWVAETAHWRVAENRFRPVAWRTVLIEKQLLVLFRREKSGRDAVHAHAFRGPLAGEKSGGAQHGRLGGGVGDHLREWQVRGDAGDVDDTALAALAHRRSKLLARQQKAADEVQVEHLGPGRLRDILERHLRCHRGVRVVAAGGIEQHSRRAKRLAKRLVARRKAGGIHRVATEKLCLASGIGDLLHTRLAALGAAAHHSNLRPGSGHRHRAGPP